MANPVDLKERARVWYDVAYRRFEKAERAEGNAFWSQAVERESWMTEFDARASIGRRYRNAFLYPRY